MKVVSSRPVMLHARYDKMIKYRLTDWQIEQAKLNIGIIDPLPSRLANDRSKRR